MSILRQGFSVFLTRVWGALVGIVVSIIIARTLGPAGKGAYSLLLLVPTLLVTFGNGGLQIANVYYKGKKGASVSKLASNSLWAALIFGLMMFALFAIGYPFIAHSFFADIPASYLFTVAALVPFMLVNSYFANLLLAIKKIKLYNLAVSIQLTTLLLAVVVLLLVFNAGLAALLSAIALNITVGATLMVFFLKMNNRFGFKYHKQLLKNTLRYGIKGYFANVIQFLNYRLDILLISFYLGTVSVGWYSVAVNFAEILWYVPTSLGTILFPHVANSGEQDANTITSRLSRQTFLLMTLASLGVAIISPWLIPLLFGPKFGPSIAALLILLPGVLIFSMAKILGNNFSGRGRVGTNGAVSALALALNITLNIILIPRMGIRGAALSSTISYSTATFILIYLFAKQAKIKWTRVVFPDKSDIKNLFFAVKKPKNIKQSSG